MNKAGVITEVEIMPITSFLQSHGYLLKNIPLSVKENLYSIPFDCSSWSGLFVHSMISEHPRSNILTDGQNIWYNGFPEHKISDNILDQKSALREHVIADIIGLSPKSETIYDRTSGTLRIADFTTSFSFKDTPYHQIIKQLEKKFPALAEFEHKEIKNIRLKRNGKRLQGFINACAQDPSTIYISDRMNEVLKKYK